MEQFTLATGLREANVTGLLWEQLDMQRRCAWIYGDQTKSGHDLAVPLNADALAVIRQQLGRGSRVFASMIYAIPGPVGMSKTVHH